MASEARRFRLREEDFAREARRLRRRAAALVAATAAVLIGVYLAAFRPQGAGAASLVVPVVLLVALAWLSHASRMRRSRARWIGFEIVLEGDAIRRELPGFPAVRIGRAELSGLDEGPRGIAVRTADGRALLVPRQLDGYDRVREALAAWRS